MQALPGIRPADFPVRLHGRGSHHALQAAGAPENAHLAPEAVRSLREDQMQGGARAILQHGASTGGAEQHSLGRDLQAALAIQPADDPVPGSIQEI